ncbi:MAG: precorrin-2 C(20)-methyltransferase [Granulosicoccus sp.]|nr:precorrin-2 C(20)-methyltransferase [Granulosicoccus sp.]
MTGTLYGVGVGPGDPELLTLKAHRLIQEAPVIAYLTSRGEQSMARSIAQHSLEVSKVAGRQEIAIAMPMVKDRTRANRVYDQAAIDIQKALDQGKDVVFLCEGDPFFYGSFAYVYERLVTEYPVQVVPGITSIQASSAIVGKPLAMLTERFVVLSGRHSDDQILTALRDFQSVAIMKPGSQRQRLLELIDQAGRIDDGCYIEYAGHAAQQVVHDLRELTGDTGPYFSLFLLHAKRDTRRPEQD